MTEPRGQWERMRDDQVWHVVASQAAIAQGVESTGERVTCVALRIAARRNGSDAVEHERTLVLGADATVDMIATLMMAANQAFGSGTMMTAFADALGVNPRDRDRTIDAVDRAIGDLT